VARSSAPGGRVHDGLRVGGHSLMPPGHLPHPARPRRRGPLRRFFGSAHPWRGSRRSSALKATDGRAAGDPRVRGTPTGISWPLSSSPLATRNGSSSRTRSESMNPADLPSMNASRAVAAAPRRLHPRALRDTGEGHAGRDRAPLRGREIRYREIEARSNRLAITSGAGGSRRAPTSGSASSAPRRWSSVSSASSGPAPPMCRSTPPAPRAARVHARRRRHSAAPDPGALCRPRLPEHRADVILLDARTCPRGRGREPVRSSPPMIFAYVIYTSGRPGAQGRAGHTPGAVNRFAWMWQQYP